MRVIRRAGDIYTVALEAERMKDVTKSMTDTESTLKVCFEYDFSIDLNMYIKQLFSSPSVTSSSLKYYH